MTILAMAMDFATGAIALAMVLCGVRLFRGPDMPDRLLAFDTLYVKFGRPSIVLGLRDAFQVLPAVIQAILIQMIGPVPAANELVQVERLSAYP